MADSTVKVIGKHTIAVDMPVLQINELIGGLSCNTDEISVAMEKAAGNSGDESFKTCVFDEWLCVLKGKIIILIQIYVMASNSTFKHSHKDNSNSKIHALVIIIWHVME